MNPTRAHNSILALVWTLFAGCPAEDAIIEWGDGDVESEAPVLELRLSPVKQFEFEWRPVHGADYYQLLESIDVGEPYVQVGEDLLEVSTSLTVPLHLRLNASYKLRACIHDDGCIESDAVDVAGPLVEAIGHFKASNAEAGDQLGYSVVLSDDGTTLAVGAPGEAGGTSGMAINQADNSAVRAGAVYVFVRDGQGTWSQQAYIKASDPNPEDAFGHSVALSGDGNTLAVGATGEASNAKGIDGNPSKNSAIEAGAAFVFVRDGQNTWSQQAYIKASNSDPYDSFGHSVALSDDGNTLAVGAPEEDSHANGIGGNQTNNGAALSGAVYVFVRDDQNAWSQQVYVKASNSEAFDEFGFSVALSDDGNALVVGAPGEDSSVGIGDEADSSSVHAGAVYVFVRDDQSTWSQHAYVKAPNAEAFDEFGGSVALSGDGKTLAVGARGEAGSSMGNGDNQADNFAPEAGAVYVFARDGQNTWSQPAYIKASNPDPKDWFGFSVALSGDGNTLAVGARWEDSSALGIGGNAVDNSVSDAGATYVFVRDGQNTWSQQAYVKASNTNELDEFGVSVALSGDGNTLAVGADESSNNAAPAAGAVYLY